MSKVLEGAFFKNVREKQGLSQATVAKKLGFSSPQVISNYERGLATISPAHFKRMAKMFEVKTVNEIISLRITNYAKTLKQWE